MNFDAKTVRISLAGSGGVKILPDIDGVLTTQELHGLDAVLQ